VSERVGALAALHPLPTILRTTTRLWQAEPKTTTKEQCESEGKDYRALNLDKLRLDSTGRAYQIEYQCLPDTVATSTASWERGQHTLSPRMATTTTQTDTTDTRGARAGPLTRACGVRAFLRPSLVLFTRRRERLEDAVQRHLRERE
jgi:hypothetical protein